MIALKKLGKAYRTKKKNRVHLLVKSVKELEIKNFRDLIQLSSVTHRLFREWSGLKNKHRKKFTGDKKIKYQYLECEAEEEIVVGLFCLLIDKVINFYKQKSRGIS